MKSVKLIENLENLDKSTWNVVRFGDVAIQQKESIDRENTDLERYIAGDHMDTNDLHIRRYGEFDGSYVGPAFHRKFEKSDILYGSRRTYLRKVAVADFDGITANTTFVIKANENLIEPRLLPFVMLSENFAQHSIQNSKGSTNPYINWKDIAWYEFRLPPMEMQKKLAELLWAVDETEEKYLESRDETAFLRKAVFDEITSKKIFMMGLGDCLFLSKTKSVPPHEEKNYIGLEHVDSGAFSTDKFASSKNVASVCGVFKNGQLLYSKLRPNLDKAVIATFDGVCTTELLVYEAKKGISLEYILHHLHSDRFIAYAISQGFGTKMPRISHKILSDFKIYVPDYKEQIVILDKLTKIRTAEMTLLKSFFSTRQLRDNLINSIF